MYTSDELLEKVNNYLDTLAYGRSPESLYQPIQYVLGLGENASVQYLCFSVIIYITRTPIIFCPQLVHSKHTIIIHFFTTT